MTERVHPRDSPQASMEEGQEKQPLTQPSPTPPPAKSLTLSFPPGKSSPLPGTYVVQIPKDQIISRPPPRYQLPEHNDRPRRSCCCQFFCWLLGIIVILIVLAGITVGILFLVYRPKAPKYSVDKISFQGFNLTSSSLDLSPRMDVNVRAQNSNSKISIYYRKGSSIAVSYSNVQLCSGVLPVFYQPTKNTTVFNTALEGSKLRLSAGDHDTLSEDETKKQIPLRLNLKVPIRIKVGSVKTWTITAKVRCHITVDKLTQDASIVSNKCKVDIKP